MDAAELAGRLEGRRSGAGWEARCPAHDDSRASLSIADGRECVVLHCHAGCSPEVVVGTLGLEMRDLFRNPTSNGNGKHKPRIIAEYDYTDDHGVLLFQAVRFDPKDFRQRRPDGFGGWTWKLDGTRRVLFRLPQIIEAVALDQLVHICEGEKDVLAVERAGGVATCNPGGAGKWRSEYSETLRGARVRIVADRDPPGIAHACAVAQALDGVAESVELVQAARGKDAHDHLAAGFGLEDFVRVEQPELPPAEKTDDVGVKLTDFYAYLPMHSYIFAPIGELWPASSVNARIPPISTGRTKKNGEEEYESASQHLDRTRAVEQMTWAPGEKQLIEGRLLDHGGWLERNGLHCFNLYRPANARRGVAAQAKRWVDHWQLVYPAEFTRIIQYLAHRVQRPGEKINHALVLGGLQGIGKDTGLEPVKYAVGPQNFQEVAPPHLLGRFNSYVKCVILRVSEARDLGDIDRYGLYEHLKTLTAAPPDVLRVDEKNIREYSVLNVCSVVITTNHVDGVYLPADDRRHYVAWSELTKEDFTPDYWNDLYRWYGLGGREHVAAYLHELDLSGFDPKAPPPKTSAFWRVVNAGRAPEDAELTDILDRLQKPLAVTLKDLADHADGSFADWLKDRRNSRQIPHRMEEVGYIAVENEGTADGRWKVGGKNQVVYARRELSLRDRLVAARSRAEASR